MLGRLWPNTCVTPWRMRLLAMECATVLVNLSPGSESGLSLLVRTVLAICFFAAAVMCVLRIGVPGRERSRLCQTGRLQHGTHLLIAFDQQLFVRASRQCFRIDAGCG